MVTCTEGFIGWSLAFQRKKYPVTTAAIHKTGTQDDSMATRLNYSTNLHICCQDYSASGLHFSISDHLTTLQTVFGLTNKLAVSGAFTLMYIYTAEIFPTQLRLVAIGASSFFARLGAILSPFVPLLVSICLLVGICIGSTRV